jgi:hypothetical protein
MTGSKGIRKLIAIPQIDLWKNPTMKSWHHGERVDPANWPWWVLCRFSLLEMNREQGAPADLRHKTIGQVGRCHENACQPETNPQHFEDCRAILYKRFYIYTRKRAFDWDLRIARERG